MTDRIVYHNSELFYYKEGIGNKSILLFHGFGQDHIAFESWNENLKNEYTIYTFDLFFHGRSTWKNQQALKKEDWRNILQLFFRQEKIENFELVGFSIGAKFVFSTLELYYERIEKIILLAPDGIKKNFWYSLATGTSLTRALFRSFILKPKPIKSFIRFLKFFKIEDRGLLSFAELQLNSEIKRERVYYSWIYFRHLNSKLSNLTLLLNSRNIPAIFILGKFDKVIPAKKIKLFANSIKNYQFHLFDCAHQDLIKMGIDCLSK